MPGFRGTMHEWKAGSLHSGSKRGPIVRSQKQALAIAFSEQREEGGSGYERALKRKGKK
jgi:uncharacterized protein DUF6496